MNCQTKDQVIFIPRMDVISTNRNLPITLKFPYIWHLLSQLISLRERILTNWKSAYLDVHSVTDNYTLLLAVLLKMSK